MEKKRKKRLILIVFAFLAVFALVGGLFRFGVISLPDGGNEKETGSEKPHYTFCRPDYSDIFTDEDYLATNRMIGYTENGVTVFTESDFSSFGEGGQCIASFLSAAIAGDGEAVNSFLSDSFLEKNGAFGKFPMQRIYDILIEKAADGLTSSSDASRFFFRVSYKIRKNDGLFDDGIPSDASRLRLYELSDASGKMMIESISDYQMK